MRAQRQRLRVLGPETPHQFGPKHARGAHLGDFHEHVLPLRPEERQARREGVDRNPRLHPRPHILDAIGQRVGHLQIGRGARFLHVVAGNADAVELGHGLRGVSKNIRNDPHRGLGRINVGVPHHVFLEDIVLDRPDQLLRRHPLLLAGHDIKSHDRNDRSVHRHGNRHLVQRDAIEERFHVFDRINRNTRFAHIADHPRMVRVVATVRGQIESHAQAHLSSGQVTAVKSVALTRGGKSRVLADGPRTDDIHRRVRSAQIRGQPRGESGVRTACEVLGTVNRFDRHLVRRMPGRGRIRGDCGPRGRFGKVARVTESGLRLGPGRIGNVFAQRFDKPRSPAGIGHPRDQAFLAQNALGIEGQTPREFRFAPIEGQHGEAVATSEHGRASRDRVTHNVRVRFFAVANRGRGHRMDDHPRRGG